MQVDTGYDECGRYPVGRLAKGAVFAMLPRLAQPHSKAETDQVCAHHETGQISVADLHTEVFTETTDHRSNKIRAENGRRAGYFAKTCGEDQAGKKNG